LLSFIFKLIPITTINCNKYCSIFYKIFINLSSVNKDLRNFIIFNDIIIYINFNIEKSYINCEKFEIIIKDNIKHVKMITYKFITKYEHEKVMSNLTSI
jgi:hypothetical protein